MAIKIDNDLLQELGLAALPEAEKNGLLKHIYETLEMRVGMRLADQMTNEQLDEFEQYFDAKDDAGAFKWLETNFPNYKDIVQQEFDKLKVEVGQSAPQILSASQQQAAAAPAAPAGPAPLPPQPPQQPDSGQPQPGYAQPPSYQQPAQPTAPAPAPAPAMPTGTPDPYQQQYQPQPPAAPQAQPPAAEPWQQPPSMPQPPQPPAQPWQPGQ